MERRLGTEFAERRLFHGTPDQETVWCICGQGFDIRLHGRHATAFGKGAYFASAASYSNSYTDRGNRAGLQHMFLATVLVGRYTQGVADMQRPPPLGAKKHGELYDCVVNNVAQPSIYVIFDNCHSYPNHLIEYRKVPRNSYSTQATSAVVRPSIPARPSSASHSSTPATTSISSKKKPSCIVM